MHVLPKIFLFLSLTTLSYPTLLFATISLNNNDVAPKSVITQDVIKDKDSKDPSGPREGVDENLIEDDSSGDESSRNNSKTQRKNPRYLDEFNKKVLKSNIAFAKNPLLLFALKFYKTLIPSPLRTGIINFKAHCMLPYSVLNNVLQGELRQASRGTIKLIFNTFFGFFGVVDVFKRNMKQKYKPQVLADTLAKYRGGDKGNFYILPILGPTTGVELASYLVLGPIIGTLGLLTVSKGVGHFLKIPASSEVNYRLSGPNHLHLDITKLDQTFLRLNTGFELCNNTYEAVEALKKAKGANVEMLYAMLKAYYMKKNVG